VLLGSEMAQISHDQTRAHYSIMNAYTHTHLANSLFKIEDMLRDEHGWSGALLVGHTSGGVARIGKTKAVDTIESGPVFGTFGAAYMARQYGLKNLICLDVGGTTTKASVVKDGEPAFKRGGELMGIPVQTSFALLRSAALGGGSVARVRDGTVELGPDSMGAAPGPACYGLGGTNATLTDALLVLGYLDAKDFLGGRRELDFEKARSAIANNIAGPLSMGVDKAVLIIRDEAVNQMARLLREALDEAGVPVDDCTLFAYGGNGPVFGAFVAEKLGIDSVFSFDIGPVFSAFGSAISDVVHVYERGIGKSWTQSLGDELIDAAGTLYRQAIRDLDGEGFDPGNAVYRYSFDITSDAGKQYALSFESSNVPGEAWLSEATDAASAANIPNDANVLIAVLRTEYSVGSHQLVESDRVGGKYQVTERTMQFSEDNSGSIMAVKWEDMGVGDHISGPAIINGETLTCAVPPGWSSIVDKYGNAQLTRTKGAGGQS
jgi:N-methylhydantoinase A/oxoprolinase/acetone carboxylase beta subunit